MHILVEILLDMSKWLAYMALEIEMIEKMCLEYVKI